MKHYRSFLDHEKEFIRRFFRYTKYGLKSVFENNGFKIVEIKLLSVFLVPLVKNLFIIFGVFAGVES